MFGSGVGGDLAQAVLGAADGAVEVGPGGDLVVVVRDPFVTAALLCRDRRQLSECAVGISPSGLSVSCPVGGRGELVGDVCRRMFSEPLAKGGMLAVGGGQLVG